MKRGTKKDKMPEPMDPSIIEVPAEEAARVNEPRQCYAIEQIVAEFLALFPETPVEYTDVNGRNTALGVAFDLTALDEETSRIDAGQVLRLLGDDAYNDDRRIETVVVDNDTESAAIIMYNNPRTMDDRSPFGLSDAMDVLTGADEGGMEYRREDDLDDDLPDDGEIVWDGGSASETSPDTQDGGGA